MCRGDSLSLWDLASNDLEQDESGRRGLLGTRTHDTTAPILIDVARVVA